ncbi:hypothetical protein [Streptomyces sp. bgisy034]|uniref:hypothetical protein n=1 Tax=Streptomyces sp. bgisy034 TaxID=3413774 RepID=UPI003EB70F74
MEAANPLSEQALLNLVQSAAPRLFAAVRTCGDSDVAIVAWGLAHDDGHTDVTTADGSARLSLSAPERALPLTGSTRLVWLRTT